MIGKYYPPVFKEEKFHCIHCSVFAKQVWYDLYQHVDEQSYMVEISMSVCDHCRQQTFWYGGRMVVPDEAPVEPPHDDLPNDCKIIYMEARSILTKSPRAAAALLRLCVQVLMPHLKEHGEDINDDIKSLVAKGLPVRIQQALDYCRVIGNNAVHPGEIVIEESPEIVQNLFEMINLIVDNQITQPKKIEESYNKLPEKKRKSIEKRDGK